MKKLIWEKLNSKYLINENWATLRVDTCRMPDGRLIPDYYVLEYPDWVNAVALTDDGQFIIVKQYRHAAADVFLELPGGCIEPGEDAETACRRELLEETGYEFDSFELISSLYANPATANNKTYCYLAKGGRLTSQQSLDSGEDIEVELHTTDSVRALLRENKFGHALHTSGLFYALQMLEVKL